MTDFIVTTYPDDFTIVDKTEDWVIFTQQDAEFTLEFQAVGLNDAAIAVAAAAAAQAAADSIGTAVADAQAAADAAAASETAASGYAGDATTAASNAATSEGNAAASEATAVAAAASIGTAVADAQAAQAAAEAAEITASGHADDAETAVIAAVAAQAAAEAAAAIATSVIPVGGGTGEALVKASNADYDYAWAAISGIGDMVAAIYDPTGVGADAFARANHTGTQLAVTISDFSTAADARVSAAIGATVQAYNANLTTWAGIAPSANAQSLVGAANYAAMRALLDLEAGTDFLSPAAIAAAYAALIHTHTVSQLSDATANGRSLISAANYAAMRALLDLEAGTDFLSPAAIAAAYAALVHTHTVSQLSDASANGRSLISAANYAAMKTLLALVKADVGLGNVDNTSDVTKNSAAVSLTNKTYVNPLVQGTVREDVFTITDAAAFVIDPTNGSVQRITLGASRTPVAANWDDGESITLYIADGTAFAITWSTIGVVWKGGIAPTLATSGYTEVNITKENGVYRGVHVGDFAS